MATDTLVGLLMGDTLAPGKRAELVRLANAAPRLLEAVHSLDRVDRGGLVPWVHNAAHNGDIEALRRICLAYSKAWNEYAVPALRTVGVQ